MPTIALEIAAANIPRSPVPSTRWSTVAFPSAPRGRRPEGRKRNERPGERLYSSKVAAIAVLRLGKIGATLSREAGAPRGGTGVGAPPRGSRCGRVRLQRPLVSRTGHRGGRQWDPHARAHHPSARSSICTPSPDCKGTCPERLAGTRAQGAHLQAPPRLLLLESLGTLAPGRGVPLPGAAAAAQPRLLRAAQRRRRRARRAGRALQDRRGTDDRRGRGQAGQGPPCEPARLPRHRAAARALAALAARSGRHRLAAALEDEGLDSEVRVYVHLREKADHVAPHEPHEKGPALP